MSGNTPAAPARLSQDALGSVPFRIESDCVYAGAIYSDGAYVKQADLLMRCNTGIWNVIKE